MSQQDPYAGMLLEMQNQAVNVQPPGWCLGRVKAIGPGRLLIQANGMTLDEEDLRVNPKLLYDAQEHVRITFTEDGGEVTLGVYATVESETICNPGQRTPLGLYGLPGYLSGTVKVTITTQHLQVGDQVVLLPDQEGQIYYVLCKVVGL